MRLEWYGGSKTREYSPINVIRCQPLVKWLKMWQLLAAGILTD